MAVPLHCVAVFGLWYEALERWFQSSADGRSLGKHSPKPRSYIAGLGSSWSSPGSGQAGQIFPVKVKHFLAQAHEVKTYHCSYQIFISLQHTHLLEAP